MWVWVGGVYVWYVCVGVCGWVVCMFGTCVWVGGSVWVCVCGWAVRVCVCPVHVIVSDMVILNSVATKFAALVPIKTANDSRRGIVRFSPA